jgi:thioredoxin-like negative regulator of GroEL
VFVRSGRNLEQFHNNAVFLLLTYADGLTARAAGDAESARRRLAQCVDQAPRFTKARLALADALMDLGRYGPARDQIAAVIDYAPDNAEALYSAAFVQIQMNHPAAARPFLDLLLSQTGDPEMKEKARTLQSYIEQGLPLKPGAPPR